MIKDTSQGNCLNPQKSVCSGQPEGCDIDEMVVDYRSRYRDAIEEELGSLSTFTDFICGKANKKEAPGIKKYCKNSHQFRMPSLTVDKACALLKKSGLERYDDFPGIHSAVHAVAKEIKQFGELAEYDFTQRYCYSRGIYPDGVYLHAGVAVGARALKKAGYEFKVVDLGERGKMIDLSTLPSPIAELGTIHAESFLCIYKHLLEKLAASKNNL